MSPQQRDKAVRAIHRRLLDECGVKTHALVTFPANAMEMVLAGKACICVHQWGDGNATIWFQKPFTIKQP